MGLVVIAVLSPNWVTWVAHRFGVGRGADLVLYLLAAAFVFVSVNTYFRFKVQENRFTELARSIAVRDALTLNAERFGTDRPVPPMAMPQTLEPRGLEISGRAGYERPPPLLNLPAVLITGGAGFIGSTVASACLDARHQAGAPGQPVDRPPRVRRRPGLLRGRHRRRRAAGPDLRRPPGHRGDGALRGAHHRPGVGGAWIRYYRENVAKTLELVDGLTRNHCHRLVFSSSASVSRWEAAALDEAVVDESAPISPSSPYARTKAITEWVSRTWRGRALEAIALRYFNPIGADPEFRTGNPSPEPSHVLGKIITAYERHEPFRITGTDWRTRNGSAIRDYIHVWDLAEAHVAALRNFDRIVERRRGHRVPYEVINLGTGDGTTVRELVEAFQHVVPGELEVETAPRRPGDVVGAHTDVTKAGRLLNWKPRFSVADGIRDALNWARAGPRCCTTTTARGSWTS